MKKQILILGKILNKTEQKKVTGGSHVLMGDCFEPGVFPLRLIARVPCNEKCPNGLTPMCWSF